MYLHDCPRCRCVDKSEPVETNTTRALEEFILGAVTRKDAASKHGCSYSGLVARVARLKMPVCKKCQCAVTLRGVGFVPYDKRVFKYGSDSRSIRFVHNRKYRNGQLRWQL